MPETTPLIKAALNLRVGAGFDVYDYIMLCEGLGEKNLIVKVPPQLFFQVQIT